MPPRISENSRGAGFKLKSDLQRKRDNYVSHDPTTILQCIDAHIEFRASRSVRDGCLEVHDKTVDLVASNPLLTDNSATRTLYIKH
jgi:hypothetical protein